MPSCYSDCIVLTTADVGMANPLKDEGGNILKLQRGDYMRWVDVGGSIGDQALLVHSKGNPVYAGVAPSANWTDYMWVTDDVNDGIFLQTLAHGTIYIWRCGGRHW